MSLQMRICVVFLYHTSTIEEHKYLSLNSTVSNAHSMCRNVELPFFP
jgi:hypothetical protein